MACNVPLWLSKHSNTSSIAGSNALSIDFTSDALDTLNKTLHVPRQYFICLCPVAACSMVWNMGVPYLNIMGKYLGNCRIPWKCKHDKLYIIAISMSHTISWLPTFFHIRYRKDNIHGNCNNPPWKCLCPRYLAPSGVECSVDQHNNFICSLVPNSYTHYL